MGSQSAIQAITSIRHVGPAGFEIRLQPWAEVEGALSSETVGFLVLERGTYTLDDGTLLEAGYATVDPAEVSQSLPLSRRFNAVPVVMTAVTSANEAGLLTSQLQTVTKHGLRFGLHGMPMLPQAVHADALSYIAWAPWSGSLQGYAFEVSRGLNVEPT